MAEIGVNTWELVEKIWTEVAAEQAVLRGSTLEPLADFDRLAQDEERRYLNDHWGFDRAPCEVQSSGLLRGLKRTAKHRAGHFVVQVLRRYFDDDQEFRAHLVRLQNKLTDQHDEARAEIRQVHEALTREVDLLWQAYAATHAALEDRVAALEAARPLTNDGSATS